MIWLFYIGSAFLLYWATALMAWSFIIEEGEDGPRPVFVMRLLAMALTFAAVVVMNL